MRYASSQNHKLWWSDGRALAPAVPLSSSSTRVPFRDAVAGHQFGQLSGRDPEGLSRPVLVAVAGFEHFLDVLFPEVVQGLG